MGTHVHSLTASVRPGTLEGKQVPAVSFGGGCLQGEQ
jgi:hypothetical protein